MPLAYRWGERDDLHSWVSRNVILMDVLKKELLGVGRFCLRVWISSRRDYEAITGTNSVLFRMTSS